MAEQTLVNEKSVMESPRLVISGRFCIRRAMTVVK